MTAAQLAEILDPSHEVAGWWQHIYHEDFDYIGPPDLHTAREHAWRMEDWLEDRDCVWARKYDRHEMINQTQVCLIGKRGQVLLEFWNTNHSAALLDAVEKITKGNKE